MFKAAQTLNTKKRITTIHFLILLIFVQGITFTFASRGLNYGHYNIKPIDKKKIKSKTTISNKSNFWGITFWNPQKHYNITPETILSSIRNGLERICKETKNCIVNHPPPKFVIQSMYWITATDAIQYVLANNYDSSNSCVIQSISTKKPQQQRAMGIMVMPSVISLFGRVRPRLLFSVGSLLRALQLCTPLQRLFDPSIGVGAGINIAAMIAGSRWVKPLILGWATTKWAWRWLGARPPERIQVPIVLSIREIEKEPSKPKNG